MTTPVYTQFPYFTPATTGGSAVTVTPAGTYSGILHTVVIQKSTTGTVTISDAVGTIALFGTSTPANSYLFDCSYAAPLKVTTTASDFVTIMAGPV